MMRDNRKAGSGRAARAQTDKCEPDFAGGTVRPSPSRLHSQRPVESQRHPVSACVLVVWDPGARRAGNTGTGAGSWELSWGACGTLPIGGCLGIDPDVKALS